LYLALGYTIETPVKPEPCPEIVLFEAPAAAMFGAFGYSNFFAAFYEGSGQG